MYVNSTWLGGNNSAVMRGVRETVAPEGKLAVHPRRQVGPHTGFLDFLITSKPWQATRRLNTVAHWVVRRRQSDHTVTHSVLVSNIPFRQLHVRALL